MWILLISLSQLPKHLAKDYKCEMIICELSNVINTVLKQRCCFTHKDVAAHFATHSLVNMFDKAADKQLLFQAVEVASFPWWI